MKILKVMIVILVSFAVIGCSKTEKLNDWELVQVDNNTWSIQADYQELEDVDSIRIDLKDSNFILGNKNGFDSKVIIWINDWDYHIDIDLLLGDDMEGLIIINDVRISGDKNFFESQFEGLITGVKVILILDERPNSNEFDSWVKENYIEIKH